MRHAKLGCALLVLVTVGVYSRTASHDFVTYDDPGYVTRNPVVKGGLSLDGVAWAFRSTEMSNWHPVTWLSHMLDVELFGVDPGRHHLVSVGMHAVSALLLFLLLRQITARPWRSMTVAALFALHPLHVESVAWVAERKDVLSGLLWHATLLAYVAYVRKPAVGRYVATLLSFAVGLMVKPMLVTLPVVLLLLDGWPLGRFRRDGATARATAARLLREKSPFLLLSVASSVVTVYAQHRGGSLADLPAAPIGLRLANALAAIVGYVGRTFWPADLAVLYPLTAAVPAWQSMAGAVVLLATTAAAIALARRAPYLVTGWLWFLVTLLPVIGLVQVGAQSMADRYTYLPLTGLFVVLVWGGADLLGRFGLERVSGVAATTAVAVLAAASWNQLGYWKDSLTLYRHTLDVTRDNHLIMSNYGVALDEAGRAAEAMVVLERAIAIEPTHAESYYNLGRVEQVKMDDPAAACALYERAIRLKPDHLDARINLGGALNAMGRFGEALEALERARALASADRAELRFNLGVAYASLGRIASAEREAEALRGLDPAMAQRLVEFIGERAGGL